MSYVKGTAELCVHCGRGTQVPDDKLKASYCSSCGAPEGGDGMWHAVCGRYFPTLGAWQEHVYGPRATYASEPLCGVLSV